jgi:predicted MFS family arabinose efflux permease
MVPLRLFGSRTYVGLSLLTFLLYGALGGLLVLLPYTLIEAAGYSALAAGTALLPMPIVIAIGSPLMGKIAARIGPRWPLTLGSLIAAASFLLALRIDAESDYWTSVLPMIGAFSIGMTMAVAPLTTAVLGSVDKSHTGTASGLNSAVARTGGLIATALLGAVLSQQGVALVGSFHAAALFGAGAALAGSLSAFILLGGGDAVPAKARG